MSRETKRFVNEINDHQDKPRSSNELLTAEKGSNSSQEIGALTSTITKLVRAVPAILLVILYSRKQSFLEANENGLRLRLTHFQGAFYRLNIQDGHEDGWSLRSG